MEWLEKALETCKKLIEEDPDVLDDERMNKIYGFKKNEILLPKKHIGDITSNDWWNDYPKYTVGATYLYFADDNAENKYYLNKTIYEHLEYCYNEFKKLLDKNITPVKRLGDLRCNEAMCKNCPLHIAGSSFNVKCKYILENEFLNNNTLYENLKDWYKESIKILNKEVNVVT